MTDPIESASLVKATRSATDVGRLMRDIRDLPANDRLEAILSCPDVMRVVRRLPIQDLFTTVREVGPGDALELIELLHPRQVQGILDLDGWRRDRLDPVAMGEWLEVLFAADPFRAVSQVRGLDVELLTLLLKIHTRVYELEHEDPGDIDLSLHSVTPDNLWLVVFDRGSGPDKLLQGLKTAVELLYGKDMQFILRLLQAVRYELPSQLEDEAYRWRNARLADLGFPDPATSHVVFGWLNPDEPLGKAASAPIVDDDEDEPVGDLSQSVLLPWNMFDDGSHVLGAALAALDDSHRRRVAHELLLLSNNVHLAEGGDLGDPGALRDTAKRAADTVGIALTYVAQGEVARAPEALAAEPVRRLFQRGHSLGLRLQRELRQHVAVERSGLAGQGLLRLDAPLREVCAGVLRRRPLCFEGLLDPQRVEFRSFGTLLEIAETAHAVTEAAFRAGLLGPAGLGVTDAWLEGFGITESAEMPSHGMLLAAAMVPALLDGVGAEELKLEGPVSVEKLAALRRLIVEGTLDDERRTVAVQQVATLALTRAPFPGAPEAPAAASRAQTYAELVLRLVVEELGAIEDEQPDARFIKTVWVGEG